VDLTALVNGLIKINDEFEVDFSFIDKVLTNMVGIQKQDLLSALKIIESPKSPKHSRGYSKDAKAPLNPDINAQADGSWYDGRNDPHKI